MKVKQLIELLAGCDAEANVVCTLQPRWPIEYDLVGVTTRDECRDDLGHTRTGAGQAGNDVILVPGEQIGYGESEA
jgi:hypothetical protein